MRREKLVLELEEGSYLIDHASNKGEERGMGDSQILREMCDSLTRFPVPASL